MTLANTVNPPLDDVLEHHGVKGMKWGVRREARLQLANRVGSGTATRGEKIKFAATQVSGHSVRTAGGLQNAGAAKARELQERKDRIQKGKATVLDYVALHGGDRLHEHSGKTHGGPRTLSIKSTDTATTKRVKNDYNTLSNREFFVKYAGSKRRYAKRVAKVGDPYRHVTTKHPGLVKRDRQVQARINTRQARKDSRNTYP